MYSIIVIIISIVFISDSIIIIRCMYVYICIYIYIHTYMCNSINNLLYHNVTIHLLYHMRRGKILLDKILLARICSARPSEPRAPSGAVPF